MRDASLHAGGYVRLYRSLLSWEWFQDSGTLHVFLFLLLSACFTSLRHEGVALSPGQLITSRRQIAARTGLTEHRVRIALDHLCATREIAIRPERRFSVITITNFARYQGLFSPACAPAGGPPKAHDGPKNNKNNHVNHEKKKGALPHERNTGNDGDGALAALGLCL